MNNNDTNIYQAARIAAGITQERAAELMGTSPRSVAAYESGERIPTENAVVRMVDVYGTQFLAYQHLRHSMESARSILPDITPQSLTMAVMRVQKEATDVLKLRDEIVNITYDGVIDETERDRWEHCMKELEDLFQAILALKFFIEEGKS